MTQPDAPQERRKENVHELAMGVETEVGGTAGETHDGILMRVLGRERGLKVATKDGPPRPRR
ncbi:MAG TPA: hypothetical protein VM582_09615 [Candidatus Thermoplasmatota archaeon]|nr:hypothetical protein [Candidatus Thermoplasmatota archaeon]